MIYLNLDSDFKLPNTTKESIKFEAFTFPGGEFNIKLTSILDSSTDVMITQRVHDSNDIMEILMAVDALRRTENVDNIELFIPYLPYARQDRVCNEGEAFSLKVFAQLINSCGFSRVHVFDAHSDVGPALIDNCVNHSNHLFIYHCVEHLLSQSKDEQPHLAIVAPDAGAVKKIYKVVQMLATIFPEVEFELITCDKVRNLATGEILRTEVYAQHVYRNCLIIDDICDGGRTVIEVAKVLMDKGADNISIAVSHGIFSKGFDVFNEVITSIYTTNSFNKGIPHVGEFPIEKIFTLKLEI